MTRDDIKNLKKYQGYPSITILAPTHRTIPDRLQDQIKTKDLISKAVNILLNEFDKAKVLPIAKTLDDLVNKVDFSKTLDGLAFFVNKDIALVYYLPYKIKEKVSISNAFETKDLLSALNKAQFFWILALSKNPTRLFKANLEHIEEIIDSPELQNQMKGFPYKHNYEVTSDRKELAYATGDLDAKYLTDLDKEFMIEVDNLLNKHIQKENLPLIILGTQKNRSSFNKISSHKDKIVGQIEGDFDKASILDIEKEVQKVIKEYYKNKQTEALNLLDQAVGQLKFSSGLEDTWHKALEGRIKTLLVEQNYQAFGTINKENPENLVLYDHQVPFGQYDIVDDLIEQVLSHDGEIIFLDDQKLKDYNHVASILRY